LPNLLSILTGEEKAPGGFRNRINFWGDITAIAWGLFFLHLTRFSFIHNDSAILFSTSLVLIAYFLFALFFAGIPRRRYWGMIFLGVSVFAIYSIAYFVFPETSPKGDFWNGLASWYMLCFVLLGVSGLYSFRKKAEPKA
jgi:peptidoglycan/LPS O-acetylase OafA/YrhL